MYLYHGKDKVAEVTFATPTIIDEIKTIYIPELMPCRNVSAVFQKIFLQKWIIARTISFARRDIKDIKDFYGTDILTSLSKISLLDGYYFAESDTEANEIRNLYYCDETDKFHTLLFSSERFPEEEFSDNSPNLAFAGNQCKFWHNAKDGLYLLNQNAKYDMGFQIAENSLQTGIVLPRKYVIHESFIHTAIPYEAFGVTENTEILPFWCFLGQMDKSKPSLEKIKEVFEADIPDYLEFISKMNEIDNLLGYDRPLENMFVLRDRNTLKIENFVRI